MLPTFPTVTLSVSGKCDGAVNFESEGMFVTQSYRMKHPEVNEIGHWKGNK